MEAPINKRPTTRLADRRSGLPAKLQHTAASRLMRYAHRRTIRTYCRPPSARRTRELRFWQQLRTRFEQWKQGDRGYLQRWQGRLESGDFVSVLFAGNRRAYDERSPQYLQYLLFGDQPFTSEEAGSFQKQPELENAGPRADLVIVERNQLSPWLPPSGSWLRSPVWVRQVFAFDEGESWDQVIARLRSQKRNLRLVRRNQLTPHVVKEDEAAFDLFYDRMHVPLIQSRHGEYGTVSSREVLRGQYRDGMLMQILTPEGEPVAADLLLAHDATLFNAAGGVLDASREWYDRGVLSALYYYEIEWAHRHNLRLFDSGESRPLLTDGVYAHKLRWGMQAVHDWRESNEWLFWMPDNSPAVRQLLAGLRFDPQFSVWEGELPPPEVLELGQAAGAVESHRY